MQDAFDKMRVYEELDLLNSLSELINAPDSVIAGGMIRDMQILNSWTTDMDVFAYYTGETYMLDPVLEMWAKSKEEPPYYGDYEPYENFIMLDGKVRKLGIHDEDYTEYSDNEHIIGVYQFNMQYCHFMGDPAGVDHVHIDYEAPLQLILVNKPTKQVVDNFVVSISQCSVNCNGELYLSDAFKWSQDNKAITYDPGLRTKYMSKLLDRYKKWAWIPDTEEFKNLKYNLHKQWTNKCF